MLSGQGDTMIILVNRDTWEWVTKSASCPQFQIDQAVKDAAENNMTEEEAKKDMLSQSSDNDRALSARPNYGEIFTDLKSFSKFVKDNNVNVIDEYEGYIY